MSQIYRFTLRTYQDVTIRFPNGWTQADVARYYEHQSAEFRRLLEKFGSDEDHDDEIEFLGFEHEMEPEDVEGVPDYDAAAPDPDAEAQAAQGGA